MKRLAIICVGVLLASGGLAAACRPAPATPTPTSSLPVPCYQDPHMAKVDTILGTLLGMKNLPSSSWVDPWREALERPTIDIGIRFDHELQDTELAAINKVGVQFGPPRKYPDGRVGYAAIVTWEQICPLLKLPGVVSMSTSWDPFKMLPSARPAPTPMPVAKPTATQTSTFLPAPTPTPTALPAPLDADIAQAKEAGQSFLTIEAGLLHPEWKDAELVSPRLYEDVDGNTIAYMFAIAKQGEVVGKIVMGSKGYFPGTALEASSAPPPKPLTIPEVRLLLERSLGLKVEERDIVGPVRHVYGGYFFYFDIYDVNGQQVAVHPVKRDVLFVPDLRARIPQPTTQAK